MKQSRSWIEYTIPPEQDEWVLEDILTGPMQISKRMIQKLTRSKGIQYNGKPTFLKRKVKKGHVVRAAAEVTNRHSVQPEPVAFDVLYEDDDILVANKPTGINVHPLQPGQSGTLANGIAWHWRQQGLSLPVRPVHRLDRDTSGAILIAKSAFAHQHLDRQLRERGLSRIYLAITSGAFPEAHGTLAYPIGKDPRNPAKRAVTPDGDPAVTHFFVKEQYEEASLLELNLDTGRTHQIRVHLAHRGFPVLGDRQYGKASPLIRRQALHACRISFVHPRTQEQMAVEAPLPGDMQHVLEELRKKK